MDVHASPAELPELREFLAAFRVRFRPLEGAKVLECYTTGLLTGLPNKNCDSLAQQSLGPASNACRGSCPTCSGMRRIST
jgi:hypothetical protein